MQVAYMTPCAMFKKHRALINGTFCCTMSNSEDAPKLMLKYPFAVSGDINKPLQRGAKLPNGETLAYKNTKRNCTTVSVCMTKIQTW